MQKIDTAELRRMWHKSEDPSVVGLDWANTRHAMHDQFLAMLDELEAARLEMRWQASVIAECKEEVRELKADYQRLEEIRRDLMERCERMRSIDGLPLDEIAARQITRDRRMKLIGAAEELERISANWYREMVAWTATDFEQQAATLRQEAEGK